MNSLTPQDVTNNLSIILSKNSLWNGKNIFLYVIANQTAGCFKHPKKSIHLKNVFEHTAKKVALLPDQVKSISTKTYKTEYAGHAKELAQGILAEVLAQDSNDSVHMIVTAGGDGTSLEVQTALLLASFDSEKKKQALLEKLILLRLPMGTGNDGTDGHKIEETMELLTGKITYSTDHAIKVYPEGNPTDEQLKLAKPNPFKYSDDKKILPPWYSFNTTSIGIDAYVCYMTNAIKRKMPGNIYQACVILSAFIYDKDFPTGKAKVEYYDKTGNKTEEQDGPITFIAFGKKGYSTYGGGHLIFPDERNVCFTKKISLPKLVSINNYYIDGSYVNRKSCDCSKASSAEKIRIFYDKPILVQCDGETVMLAKEHFPLVMEKTEPFIRIITKEK